MNLTRLVPKLLYLVYLVFLLSMICGWRGVSSVSTGLILALSITYNKQVTGKWFSRNLRDPIIAACLIFYFFCLLTLFYTHDIDHGLKKLQVKSGLIFIPVAVLCSDYLTNTIRQNLLKNFVWMLTGASLFCLAMAFHKFYFLGQPDSVFFYHKLVAPLLAHAIMMSILVFIGICYLLERMVKKDYLINAPVHFALIIYLYLFIILLASKLVIVFTTLCAVYYIVLYFKVLKTSKIVNLSTLALCVAMIVWGILSTNPVRTRFEDLMHGNANYAKGTKFTQGDKFNGLEFRLLQWRFVKEILTENNRWLIGMSAGDGQSYIDKKYISSGMYTGTSERKDAGFIGFDTHNGLLQATLEAGLAGGLAFLFICGSMVRLVLRSGNRLMLFVVALLLIYTMNEAVFQTQYGLAIFIFFPLFLYISPHGQERSEEIERAASGNKLILY